MKTMTRQDLAAVLEDMLIRVRNGDSLEGSIQYLLSEEDDKWDVEASYRIGNTEGQGGVRLI